MAIHFKFQKELLLAVSFLIATQLTIAQKVVHYDLHLNDTIVNFAGKSKRAIAVNGQIPMPTLTFTEGDTAEIIVYNHLKEDASLHWHGIFLPNKEDGVPHLTQHPIAPGATYTYRFPIIQHGTHWYHSHSGFQEQIGLYGSFIILKKEGAAHFRKGIDDLPTMPIILSEWTNLNPNNVQRMLHNANDWFAIKKGTTQSYAEAINAGHFKTKLTNEWKRMLAMDVSDVYYEKVLINGSANTTIERIASNINIQNIEKTHSSNLDNNSGTLKAGDKVRLRISNGGASSYFWLQYAGGKITVVASDGNDVEPVEVDRLIIAVSETYDIVITIPESGKSYEFLATTEDRSQSASLYLGKGTKQPAKVLPKLKYFEGMKMMNGMMKMNGDMNDMGMKMSLNQMDMNAVMYPEISGNLSKKYKSKSKHNNKDTVNREVQNHTNHQQKKKQEHTQDHTQHKEEQHDHGQGHHQEQQDIHEHQQEQQQTNENEHVHEHNDGTSGIVTLNYAMLKSTQKTTLPTEAPIKHIRLTLTGNMNRYVWSMDNRVLSESDKIPVKKGEIVRITLYNNSMMRHPIHLHGFDFRVLNGHGDFAPLKNVIDVMPMETNTIEFLANTEGDWFFHCHILYHMMAGMNRVFEVGDYQNPLLPNKVAAYKMLQRESNMPHLMAENDFATNGNDGQIMVQNARWSLSSEWRLGYNKQHGYEIETHLGRYLGSTQWLMPFVGFDYRYRKMGHDEHDKNLFGQTNKKDSRRQFSVGFVYTLPMLINFQTEVYHDGIVRLQLMREDIPISPRLRAGFMINTDKEYMGELSYILSKNIGIRTHYDSDMGFGVGLALNY